MYNTLAILLQVHYITLHYITLLLHYITLQLQLQLLLHYITISITLHYINLTLHYITFAYIFSLNSILTRVLCPFDYLKKPPSHKSGLARVEPIQLPEPSRMGTGKVSKSGHDNPMTDPWDERYIYLHE